MRPVERSKGVRLVVDGKVFQQQVAGGVARVHAELLPRLCDHAPELRVRLVTEGTLSHPLPRHDRIRAIRLPSAHRLLRPGRLWRDHVASASAAQRKLAFGSGRDRIWHSTHYTSPDGRWDGHRVVTVYDLIHERRPDLYRKPHDDAYRAAKRAAVESADAVIAISAATAEDVATWYGPEAAERTTVVPLAPSPLFTPGPVSARRVGPDRPFLLHVGGRFGHKAFDWLLAAYAAWPAHTEVDLVTVGRPWDDEEVRRLVDLGLTDRVQRLDPVPDETLVLLYREAVGLVQASVEEGFGLPLIEAMATGCPVVARRLPATVELADGVPHYLEGDDLEAATAAFDALLARPDPARVDAGVTRASALSWDAAAAATVGVYRSLGS
jgi:glycosyltransferase involved in cell wall biosynthesis